MMKSDEEPKKPKKTKEQREQEKRAEIESKLSVIPIQTLGNKVSLLSLINGVGVKNAVVYFNIVEMSPKFKSKTKQFVATKIFDYGLIFNDGFEIRHVSSKIYKMVRQYAPQITVMKKRERVPNYNPLATKQMSLDI